MKCILTLLILLVMISIAGAQAWMEGVQDQANFDQIVANAEMYFADKGKGRGSGYKQYMRWKMEMEHKVGADGLIKNFPVLDYQIYQREQARWQNIPRTAHGDWECLGPFDYSVSGLFSDGGVGRVSCTAFHPTDPNTMWVGTPAGGLWKTTDGGTTWQPLTDGLAAIGIGGITVDPTNPDKINILTGDNASGHCVSIGTLYSQDGGLTWTRSDLQFEDNTLARVHQLKSHPDLPYILFAAFRENNNPQASGLYRSADGGITWDQVITSGTVWDIEFKPGAPSVIYAAVKIGNTGALAKSADQGLTWNTIPHANFPASAERMSIAISPSMPNNLYAVFGGDTGMNGVFNGLFKSTNSGATFTLQSTTPNILGWALDGQDDKDQAWRDLAIIVDPQDDTRIFVGAVNLWGSENSGMTWDRKTWFRRSDVQPYVHADWQNLYFQGSDLYANVDGGIYKSADLAESWNELSAGLAIMQFYEIDAYNNTYMGGSQDNGVFSSLATEPQAFQLLGSSDGFGCTWHWENDQIQFFCNQGNVVRRQFGNNIIIWSNSEAFWGTELNMHTTDPNYLYLDSGTTMFRGNQNTSISDWNWIDLEVPAAGGGITDFSQGVSDPEVMYVSKPDTLYKTTNLHTLPPTWSSLTDPDPSAKYSDIVVDPANSNRVWATCSGYVNGKRVFYSSNGGTSWTDISGSLPPIPIRCITYHAGSNDGLYIGTDIGIYYRNASMSDWIFFSTYLPNVPVNDIDISDGYVYAGTFGRGIWRAPVFACPTDLVLTQANDPVDPLNIGQQVHAASNSVHSSRIVRGSFSDVTYKAGDHVDLLPGFLAEKESLFNVYVEGCDY